MEVYRISQEPYSHDLSGNGSRLFGGRWNSEGIYALYTSMHRSLALLETLTHTPSYILEAKAYILSSIFIPDAAAMQTIDLKKLSPGWNQPDIQPGTRKTGDEFLLEQKKLLLKVPSVLVPEEFNYIINPLHADMKQVRIIYQRALLFDKRIIKAQ
jgi:RES domain-containing protein